MIPVTSFESTTPQKLLPVPEVDGPTSVEVPVPDEEVDPGVGVVAAPAAVVARKFAGTFLLVCATLTSRG